MRVILAGGGTGGHITPALSIAQILLKESYTVLLITDQKFHQFDFYKIEKLQIKSLKIENPKKKFFFYLSLLKAIFKTFIIFKEFQPDLVLTFGAYPSIPSIINSIIFRKKQFLHEANTVLGKTNRIFSKFAHTITTGFPLINNQPSNNKKTFFTGNPIHQQIKPFPCNAINKKVHILIYGGSQSASILSKIVPKSILYLKKYNILCNIAQQCKLEELDSLKEFYNKNNISNTIQIFFTDLYKKIEEAHIIICRAGAITISEINTIGGRYVIYIPLPNSAHDHQLYNAKYISNISEASSFIEQNTLSSKILTAAIIKITKKLKKNININNNNELQSHTASEKILKILQNTINN